MRAITALLFPLRRLNFHINALGHIRHVISALARVSSPFRELQNDNEFTSNFILKIFNTSSWNVVRSCIVVYVFLRIQLVSLCLICKW